MSRVIHIWTVQLSRARKLQEQGIVVIDSTVKSGLKFLAPSWEMVMAYKDGKLSEAQYTDQYLHRMRDSRENSPQEWKKLQAHEKVAFACYCTPGKFCHRHLLVKDVKTYLEGLGYEVKLMGEINGPQYYSEPPKAIVSIPRDVKIIPFYGKGDLLSNHHADGFTVKGVKFRHVEQFLMFCKARLFNDKAQADRILAETDPVKCKGLGRGVRPFDNALWLTKRKRYLFIACLQKAREHSEVRDYLLSTENAVLVEASPTNVNYGVGIAKTDPRIYDMAQWQGINIGGEVWMDVRKILQAEMVF